MLDMGWSEMTLVMIVLLIVVGPSELPKIIKGMRSFMSSMQRVRSEIRGHMDEMVREADLKEVLESEKQSVSDTLVGDREIFNEHLEPLKTIEKDVKDMQAEIKNVGKVASDVTNQEFENKTISDKAQVK